MVMNMLGIKESPSFYDATDALAVAITHALRFDSASASKSSSWEQFIKDNPGRVVKK
jgi:crossover junction endodeoxyribonuclease RuvC